MNKVANMFALNLWFTFCDSITGQIYIINIIYYNITCNDWANWGLYTDFQH